MTITHVWPVAKRFSSTMSNLSLFFAIILICQPAYAGHLYSEKYYQEKWCRENQGITEYVLDDKTRVDCLTCEYAIEFDFAEKWTEAVGQALYYSLKTGKRPGIVLIMENRKDKKYLHRLQTLTERHNIRLWIIHEHPSN